MNIKSIRASVSFEYTPESYLEYCEESGESPTQQGFVNFISDDIISDIGTEALIEEIE